MEMTFRRGGLWGRVHCGELMTGCHGKLSLKPFSLFLGWRGAFTGGATVTVICWTWLWLLYVLCSSSSWPVEAPVNWCASWSHTRTKNSCGPPPASSRCCPCAPATNPRLWRLVSSDRDRRIYSCQCWQREAGEFLQRQKDVQLSGGGWWVLTKIGGCTAALVDRTAGVLSLL